MNNGRICVSVCAKTSSEFVEQIERAAAVADVIELRFDCLNENEIEQLLLQLKKLCGKIAKPFLATARPKSKYADLTPVVWKYTNEDDAKRRRKEKKERIELWQKILDNNAFDWVDVEHDLQNLLRWNLYLEAIFENETSFDRGKNFVAKLKTCRLIVSEHFADKVPDNLDATYQTLATNLRDDEAIEEVDVLTSGIIKIAVQASDVTNGLEVMKLLECAKAENRLFIPIAMGEAGIWTRILGLARGAFMTYAALDKGKETAPGQLTAQELIDVYRVKELNEATEIYGIVGDPVAHSVSPEMHNAAFKHHNLNAVYIPFTVKNLDDFIRRMIQPETREIEWNLRGFSVTAPHKTEITKHLDFVDETAKAIGAVNTVVVRGNDLHGYNTDAAGFVEPLKNSFGNLNGAKVAVLGAGGAARAAVYALGKENAKITLFARHTGKAKSLADDFGVQTREISNFKSEIEKFDVVINATPLGTRGALQRESPVTAEQLQGAMMVYDLVYNPLVTKFMSEAQTLGIPTLGGLAMLVAQAQAQSKLWTELDAPIKVMSAPALRKIQQ